MDVAALPELLADNGYWNVISGKWHLGFRDEHLPSARGFHKSWALLPGCNNHFGWEPNWVNNDGDFPRVVGNQPPLYVEDGVKVMPVSPVTICMTRGKRMPALGMDSGSVVPDRLP